LDAVAGLGGESPGLFLKPKEFAQRCFELGDAGAMLIVVAIAFSAHEADSLSGTVSPKIPA
jgi:hypothetical protein